MESFRIFLKEIIIMKFLVSMVDEFNKGVNHW